ncbi:uncharacterized protein LOC129582035 isoform X2 [Paramacrobiotus metropolitanus]|uniref:uncharacterized protein LOC129582035 isoform X2 n=1 Tax=Paramacrobiotus metropolitanus TaxID=2943436 RepID=UPI0024461F6F|nr:uncharacterized protein LOC129582035 isoform X2 [Paramacrobiotus metropolitanus]
MFNLDEVLRFYAEFLQQWLHENWPEKAEGLFSLDAIANLYGKQKLIREYREANAIQSGGSRGLESTDWTKYFTLEKINEKQTKKFSILEITYRVKIENLNMKFDPVTSMEAMPKVFEAIFSVITKEFGPDDRIVILLSSHTLNRKADLHMKRLQDFKIDDLMDMMVMINSSNSFCIDESFQITIVRTVIPAGGRRRKHIHTTVDRKRFSSSIVTVTTGNNLCLPAALALGHFRNTHDVSGKDKMKWKALTNPRGRKLEKLACQLVQDAGLTIGKMFGLEDLPAFQRVLKCQVKVISVQEGNTLIAQVPEKKKPGMKQIYLMYDKNHFDLITKPSGYHMQSYYCTNCDQGYGRKTDHRCEQRCNMCYRSKSDCKASDPKLCPDCGRTFTNKECFDVHKTLRKNGRTLCEDLFICSKCNKVLFKR